MASIRTKHLPLPAIQVLLVVAPFLLHVGLAQNSGVGSIVTSSLFEQIFPNHNTFYTYDSFISAAGAFPSFGTTGSSDVQKQEIAAFFAHAFHETSGLTAINENTNDPGQYCDNTSTQYPCAAGQFYYGRGPLQITWNYNYGQAGADSAISQNLLGDPDLVSTDPTISFETALWFWTTPQAPKPSCHDVMDGTWQPSADDTAAGRTAGFGETINIINGGIECGPNASTQGMTEAQDRVTQYQNICSQLGVDPGPNLDCTNATPY